MFDVPLPPDSITFDGEVYSTSCKRPGCNFTWKSNTYDYAACMLQVHIYGSLVAPGTISWRSAVTLLESLWAKADQHYDALMGPELAGFGPGDPQKAKAQGILRGYCESILVFMDHVFATPDDVAREIVKRGKARAAGESYETIGLGSRRYEMPFAKGSQQEAQQTAMTKGLSYHAAKEKPKVEVTIPVHLTVEQQAAIRNTSGMFPVAELAKLYNVSPAVINHILSSIDVTA